MAIWSIFSVDYNNWIRINFLYGQQYPPFVQACSRYCSVPFISVSFYRWHKNTRSLLVRNNWLAKRVLILLVALLLFLSSDSTFYANCVQPSALSASWKEPRHEVMCLAMVRLVIAGTSRQSYIAGNSAVGGLRLTDLTLNKSQPMIVARAGERCWPYRTLLSKRLR